MSRLSSEEIAALSNVIVRCREAAIQHRTAANVCGDTALVQALESLSRERLALFRDIAPQVGADFETPATPAHEKELLDSVMGRLKAEIGQDKVVHLLDDCQSKETRVAEAAGAALLHVGDPSIRYRLESLRKDAMSRIALLRNEYHSS